MEGIAKIKETILEEANQEKEKIINEAKTQAKEIEARYKSQADQILGSILEKAKKAAEEKKRRIISMAELENRKALLKVKQEIIDEVFEKAKEKIKALPDEQYRNLIADMLMRSTVTGNEEVIISETDRQRITPEFIQEINKKLKDIGKEGNLRISDVFRDMIGGFILKSKDVEINSTFDSLIKMEREELETEIAKILFEE